MRATKHNIERVYNVINKNLFTICGKLDYSRVTHSVMLLADLVHRYPGEFEDIAYIGEFSECCLSDLIIGAYWHYTEWHAGQWSKEYQALCALGSIFDPGMTSIESEKADGSSSVFAYEQLEAIADN